jgi:hypothetical protein
LAVDSAFFYEIEFAATFGMVNLRAKTAEALTSSPGLNWLLKKA